MKTSKLTKSILALVAIATLGGTALITYLLPIPKESRQSRKSSSELETETCRLEPELNSLHCVWH